MRWYIAWFARRETLQDELAMLNEADVVSFSWAQFFESTTPQNELLKRIKKGQFVHLFIDVSVDDEHGWSTAKRILEMFIDKTKSKSAELILHTPTDPKYEVIAKECGYDAPHFKAWITVPFAFAHVHRAYNKEPFFLHYRNDTRDKGTDIVEAMLGMYPIVMFGPGTRLGWISLGTALMLQARSFALLFPSRNDSIGRMLIQAGVLLQVPIIMRTKAAYLRTLTFGFKDKSLFVAVPVASDVNEFIVLTSNAFGNWKAFYETWAPKWISFFWKFEEFWHHLLLWQRWHDEMPIPLPGDLSPLHHCFWLTRDELATLPDGPWKKVEWAINAGNIKTG